MSTCQSHLPGVQGATQTGSGRVFAADHRDDSDAHTAKTLPDPLRGSRRRPPSVRDLRMYDRVVVEEVSQYVVAAEEKLTQGYVSKRVRRVIEWMGRVGNKEYGAAPANEKLLYLQRFAEKKYDFYRRESEAAFRESRQDLVVIKERGTRQAAEEGDEKNVGKFVGEVKIEKTIRPREGKPQFLREARLGVENLVLLACHVVARQQLPLPSEPDEEAQQQKQQKWEQLQRELAAARILDAKVACREQEILFLKQDLAVARRELASSQRMRHSVSEQSDHAVAQLRQELSRHGIIPERQKFPRLETVRRGAPFTMSIPADRGRCPQE